MSKDIRVNRRKTHKVAAASKAGLRRASQRFKGWANKVLALLEQYGPMTTRMLADKLRVDPGCLTKSVFDLRASQRICLAGKGKCGISRNTASYWRIEAPPGKTTAVPSRKEVCHG